MVKKTDKNRSSPSPKTTLNVVKSSSTQSGFYTSYASVIAEELEMRKELMITMGEGKTLVNVTPPLLEDINFKEKLANLYKKIENIELPTSAEEVLRTQSFKVDSTNTISQEKDEMHEDKEKQIMENEMKFTQPYIKIILRKSEEILLFEQQYYTVLRDSEEAQHVEADNKFYDYLTQGKGRVRRTVTSETQTENAVFKSREVNTEFIEKTAVVSYVSNFEMFDTYKNLETTTKSVEVGDSQKINVTTYKVGGVDQFEIISKTNNFKLALMITLRMLAGNIFEAQQRRFRNMIMPDPFSKDVVFKYTVEDLFDFELSLETGKRIAVCDMAFCPANGDILAVAYGLFSYGNNIPNFGYCCIWNIKNPVNPERFYEYNLAIVSVEFSTSLPQLLAIGLYDGSVEVRDIGTFDDIAIAVSPRTENSTCDPIVAIKWVQQTGSTGADSGEIDPILALARDGSVTKYRVINSPNLLGFPQMQLDRVEGTPEGLTVDRPMRHSMSSCSPQGVDMILHPLYQDIYYLLTDEGCIHKCSTNYPHQHLEVLQVHNGTVNTMDFSPWSPKVFLTAGNDWRIRIWMEDIFEPLITLKNENTPILSAAWSKTHSTIIISNTRKTINIWDIRRSTLQPMFVYRSQQAVLTLFKFSLCGRSMAIGKERSHVLIKALEDFPFPPHFQYDELELAIYKAIAMKPELVTELKSIGFFGYPQDQRRNRCM